MKDKISKFIECEQITFAKLFNPAFILQLLYKYKYIHFFLIGMTGVGLALLITWSLTEYVFGLENYFTSYLIGLAANLVFNFTLHTYVSFNTHTNHPRRFVIFVIFSILMVSLQALTVKILTPLIGIEFYLLVIASVILVYSSISYFIFKFIIFSE